MTDAWRCPSTIGPGDCENHAPHVAPRGCVHYGSYVADDHDASEAQQD